MVKLQKYIDQCSLMRRVAHELLIFVHFTRWQRMPRSEREKVMRHAYRVLEAPDFGRMTIHRDAGHLRRFRLIMHNGLKVLPTAYYGWQFLARSRISKTVGEPQEERVFGDLLPLLPAGSVMLELGAFWSFYSLWFHSVVERPMNYMIEPELRNLSYGRTNFEINGYKEGTDFTNAFIGAAPGESEGIPVVSIDQFCGDKGIDRLTILHSDIQGSESNMLDGARRMLEGHSIDYLFISTHSNSLHEECLGKLRAHGYEVVTDANLDEAY